MKPIYEPKGAAKEYGDLALNIYTGCPHRCEYCYVPSVLRKDKEMFHSCVEPRKNIVEETRKQIGRESITGKTIFLCFTCDPYPNNCEDTVTREIIRLLKDTGNHIIVLTKNGVDCRRDFDLLDSEDWFGVTIAGYNDKVDKIPKAEPGATSELHRLQALKIAHDLGIKTWVSCEPVLNPTSVIELIEAVSYVDMWKVGKLNHHSSDIDWADFGTKVERNLQWASKRYGCEYMIKGALRKEMQKGGT